MLEVLAQRIRAQLPELLRTAQPPGMEDAAVAPTELEQHLSTLADALEHGDPEYYGGYVAWRSRAAGRAGHDRQRLRRGLEAVAAAVLRHLPEDDHATVRRYLDPALERLPPPRAPATCGEPDGSASPLVELAARYTRTLLGGDRQAAARLVLAAAEGGTPVRDIYLQVFQRSQHVIGDLWQANRISVAQEHFCTAATQLIMTQLYPYVFAASARDATLVATCVGGELHELGIRMVADFFEMDGWDSRYLGANTPDASVVDCLEETGAQVLGISATMTYHVGAVQRLIRAVRSSAAASTRILVGGYPFLIEEELWRRVGADGFAHDAGAATELAKRLLDSWAA